MEDELVSILEGLNYPVFKQYGFSLLHFIQTTMN